MLAENGSETFFDAGVNGWAKDLVANVTTPNECQSKCQETLGCYYFEVAMMGTDVKCKLYNEFAIKPLFDLEHTDRNYWKNLRWELSSETVTLIGPRKCPNKNSMHFLNKVCTVSYYKSIIGTYN